MAKKRIQKELLDLQHNPPFGCWAGLRDEADPFRWVGTIIGPVGTPYSGGIFSLGISLPPEYPFKPPKLHFTTRIFHPNINLSGDHCLESIDSFTWKPAFTVAKALVLLRSLLSDPTTDFPMNSEAASIFKTDRNQYNAIAKQWTDKYATEANVHKRLQARHR